MTALRRPARSVARRLPSSPSGRSSPSRRGSVRRRSAPLLTAEWHTAGLRAAAADGRRPARLRGRGALALAVTAVPRRRAAARGCSSPERRGRGRQPRLRVLASDPVGGAAVPVPDRGRDRGRLPGRDQAHRGLVPGGPRPRDRRAHRRADGRLGPAAPVPRARGGRRARLAPRRRRRVGRRARRAAILVAVFGRAGPFETPAPRFSPAVAAAAFREPAVRLANLGYLGHMWELYAMWTWVPAVPRRRASRPPATTIRRRRPSPPSRWSPPAGSAASRPAPSPIASAGRRRRSGRWPPAAACAVAIGFLFGAPPLVVLALAVVWGVTVVADSAQFSAAVSELSPAGTAGSALSVQMAMGFILTGVTILGIGLRRSWRRDRLADRLRIAGPRAARRRRRDVAAARPPGRREDGRRPAMSPASRGCRGVLPSRP